MREALAKAVIETDADEVSAVLDIEESREGPTAAEAGNAIRSEIVMEVFDLHG